MHERSPEGQRSAAPVGARVTRAGRLLASLTKSGAADLDDVARAAKIAVGELRGCRDGVIALDLEAQMILAAVVTEKFPSHARLARRLYAQAQSALRVRAGYVVSHMTYVGRCW